jgi:predicted DsbA family dithiol-disulfide isomerase
MKPHLKIDFVSDIACPWCAIGLNSLETALTRVGDEIDVELHFQPFELNPQMPASGQDANEHLMQKYGLTPEQAARTREGITERGAQVGFRFDMSKRSRIYNTFDAHRLLHWAEEKGRGAALKHALLDIYFAEGGNPSDHAVLADAAKRVGLDTAEAMEILSSQTFAKEVRERQQFYTERGIHAVPSVIVNDQHLIQGGQPPEVFEQALRRLANVEPADLAARA